MGDQKAGLLNSWKEVASYLGRGVRTVQRWESLGLPVRRVGNGSRAPVIAYTSDIDRWMQQARSGGLLGKEMVEQVLCKGDLRESIEQSRMLREQLALLRANQRNTMTELMSTISKLEKSCSNQEVDLSHARPEPMAESFRPAA